MLRDVAGQWVYDAYGEVLVADHLLPFPQMHLGHKGIFIDRLDVAVVDSAGNESPRLVPFGHTICHNRNRLYLPQLGRFFQLDPNATAMALLESSASHGRKIGRSSLRFNIETLYGDGLNIYDYTRSNPVTNSDPLGLFVGMLSIACPGPGNMITGVLQSLVSEYAANLDWDVEWAVDWSLPDDAHSRTDSSWIKVAMLRGLHNACEIGIPFTDISAHPLDALAGAVGSRFSQRRIRVNGSYANFTERIHVKVPSGSDYVNKFKHPQHTHPFVIFPESAIQCAPITITPAGNPRQDTRAANRKFDKPDDYTWEIECGCPCTWHHDNRRGVMILVPTDLHREVVPHTGGAATWGRIDK